MTQSDAETATVRCRARGKVNLFLHVTGRRADGYHELDSLVVFTELGDELTFAAGDDLALDVVGPQAAALVAATDRAEANLVLRAGRALQGICGATRGARVTLEKHLPVAAGLGGGSADAAATLRGLAALWRCQDLSMARLTALAATLGADVPVCLVGQPGRVRGIGERIEPTPGLPRGWLVLVNPGKPLATSAVFATHGGPFSAPAGRRPGFADVRALAAWLRAARNDLEAPARALLPEISDVLSALEVTEGCLLARMSGSGASCFGLYAAEGEARAAAQAIAGRWSAWWVRPTAIAGDDAPDRDAAGTPIPPPP